MRERNFHCGQALLPDGWARDVRMTVSNGSILAIAPNAPAEPTDDRLSVVLPGLPNLHSHAFQRGMAGLAEVRGKEEDSFWTWRDLMYRFVDRLTPESLQAIAALAYVEMLETGFTRVGEFHYVHHDRGGARFADPAAMSAAIVEAAAETGIGLTLLPVFYAHAGFGGLPPGPDQTRFVHNVEAFSLLLEAIDRAVAGLPDPVVGLAPHSLRAVTPEELAALAQLARSRPIHIHIAEQSKEVEDCLDWSGSHPVSWLLDHAAVGERWCLIHATHLTDAETMALAQSGAVVGLCPITEANLGDGLFPARRFLEVGGRIGIGSDSNIRIDMGEELRLLEYGQRLAYRVRNVLTIQQGDSTGESLFRRTLAGGGQALAAAAGLAPGASADFITLDPDHPSLAGRSGAALIDGLVFAAGRDAIDGVWRRGVQLVSGGRHRAREAILRRYRATLEQLLS
jgi:formiminoglutamate deiminase